jgi:hypothetical protein
MNKIEIEKYDKELKRLIRFIFSKKEFKETEIVDWISNCVNVFSNIGVDQIIIEDFLRYFVFREKKVAITDSVIPGMGRTKDVWVKMFGPFRKELEKSYDLSRDMFSTSGDQSNIDLYKRCGSLYYMKIAFSSATNILKNKEYEKRLVPIWLIESLEELGCYSNILISLEQIESKYQDKNIGSLISNATTLLDSILNLDSDLNEKTLGKKLFSLEDKKHGKLKRVQFGVSRDLIISLNCSRVIRNEKEIHRDKTLKYNIPFMVAVSYAYLVIFFLESVILNGNLINEKNK